MALPSSVDRVPWLAGRPCKPTKAVCLALVILQPGASASQFASSRMAEPLERDGEDTGWLSSRLMPWRECGVGLRGRYGKPPRQNHNTSDDTPCDRGSVAGSPCRRGI
jgi:hypothetical protein